MKVVRLISRMVAFTPSAPGTVWATRSKSSSPSRQVVRPVWVRARRAGSRLNIAKTARSRDSSSVFGTGSMRNEKPSIR